MSIYREPAEEYSFWRERVRSSRYQDMLIDFGTQAGQAALDAGCGPGYLSLFLAQHFSSVVGIDTSEAMIALAKQKRFAQQDRPITFLIADLSAPPFKPQTFDFVGSDHVLHDTDVEVTLPNLRHLVKPGGWLMIHDLVASNPRKDRSPARQFLTTVRRAPSYFRKFGIRDARRLIAFEANPSWIRHHCESMWMTPTTFRDIFGRHLPGCWFVGQGTTMTVYWQAPADLSSLTQ